MGVYLYCIRQDYKYKSSIKGRKFENEWFKLDKDGTVTIKGTHDRGYAWDGCTPKFKIKDMCIGTPEGVLNPDTGKSKTYHASLIHDVLYQFSPDIRSFVKRSEVDQEFYNILKKNKFESAKLYYLGVRLGGWPSWYRKLSWITIGIVGLILLVVILIAIFR
jgi:hypothetical protein